MKKLGYTLLLVVAAAAAWLLLQQGFGRIQSLRQLERVPAAQAAYVLPGEVTLNATARVHQQTTGSYFTQTPSLFYHYRRERRTTDSEGKTRWDTEFSYTDGVDFLLEDSSGRILVHAAGRADRVHWSLRQSFSETRGDIRHSEWRVEPGDTVFVFAKAMDVGGTIALHFDQPGFYEPILSHFSQADSQATMGNGGLWALWAGLSCLALAVFAFHTLFNLHRILLFVFVLALVQILVLVQVSLLMMRTDLQNGLTRYNQQNAAAELQAKTAFEAAGLSWSGWSDLTGNTLAHEQQNRLEAYQTYLALNQQHLSQQMNAKPERWLLPLWQLSPPEPMAALSPEVALQIRHALAKTRATRLEGYWPWIALALGALAAALLTWLAVRLIRVKRLIENLPHCPTKGVACGITEVHGQILADETTPLLQTPRFQTPCVWYFYHKQERRGSGKKTRWVTLEKETRCIRFWLQDSEGQLPVVAENAEVITRHSTSKTEGRLRYTERALKNGDPIYAVGTAAIDPTQPDRLLLSRGNIKEPFILSNYSEREVMLRKATASMLTICAAFAGLLLAMLMGSGINAGFSPLDFLAAAATLPAYMLVLMLILHYNDLIFLRQRALRNWSNIDVSLKKRKDLVDNFAKTAKTFLDHERTLQQKLAQLRAALTQTQGNQVKVAEYLRQEQAFHQMLTLVVEKYPDLKGQELLQRLMKVITEGETEIALLRQGYNDAATMYNTRIATIPDVVFAKLFQFQRLELIAT